MRRCAQGGQGWKDAARSHRKLEGAEPPLESLEDSDFRPPELGENTFLIKATQLMALCFSSPKKVLVSAQSWGMLPTNMQRKRISKKHAEESNGGFIYLALTSHLPVVKFCSTEEFLSRPGGI